MLFCQSCCVQMFHRTHLRNQPIWQIDRQTVDQTEAKQLRWCQGILEDSALNLGALGTLSFVRNAMENVANPVARCVYVVRGNSTINPSDDIFIIIIFATSTAPRRWCESMDFSPWSNMASVIEKQSHQSDIGVFVSG